MEIFILLWLRGGIWSIPIASLNQPDTWSFTTTDRIWFNQNWGSHLILYLTHLGGGEFGLLVLKALLLIIMAAAIVMLCRLRGVNWPVAILTSGAAIAGVRNYTDLRPNLITLTIIPVIIWLLYRSQDKPHLYWAVMLLTGLWANLHGGFIFGLGMMGLWSVCWLGFHAIRNGIKSTLRTHWPVLAGLIGAIIFAGVLSPFGITGVSP